MRHELSGSLSHILFRQGDQGGRGVSDKGSFQGGLTSHLVVFFEKLDFHQNIEASNPKSRVGILYARSSSSQTNVLPPFGN